MTIRLCDILNATAVGQSLGSPVTDADLGADCPGCLRGIRLDDARLADDGGEQVYRCPHDGAELLRLRRDGSGHNLAARTNWWMARS